MVQYRFAFKKGFILNYAIQQKTFEAALAQLGERQTEDLKAPCSIHGGGNYFMIFMDFWSSTILQNMITSQVEKSQI